MASAHNGNTQAVAFPATLARHGESLDLSYFMERSDQFNNLVPFKTIKPMSPYMMMGLSVIRLNPDPNAGDVYKDGNSLRPSKVGLMKLSAGSGIQWVPNLCRVVERTDNRCRYEAVGYLVGPDGVPKPIKGSKEIDLLVVEEEARLDYEEKLEKGREEWTGPSGQRTKKLIPWKDDAERDSYIDRAVRKAVLQKRKNLVSLAETGAYLRAIRSSLALKSNWTAEELSRPFVMVRSFLDPEADREMAKETIRASVQSLMYSAPAMHETPELPAPGFDPAGLLEAPEADDTVDGESTEVYEGEIPEGEGSDQPSLL